MKVPTAPSPGRGSILESKVGKKGGLGGEKSGEEEETNGGEGRKGGNCVLLKYF